jgi:hypothetical protein
MDLEASIAPGTFAAEASQGASYSLTCQSCGHWWEASAAQVVAAGKGHISAFNSQRRWRCPSCRRCGADVVVRWPHVPAAPIRRTRLKDDRGLAEGDKFRRDEPWHPAD